MELLNTEQAAQRLGVTKGRISQLVQQGKLKVADKGEYGRLYFTHEEIERRDNLVREMNMVERPAIDMDNLNEILKNQNEIINKNREVIASADVDSMDFMKALREMDAATKLRTKTQDRIFKHKTADFVGLLEQDILKVVTARRSEFYDLTGQQVVTAEVIINKAGVSVRLVKPVF